ncbi:MAG: DIP1984 family protein [Methanomassiliicoccaceae archaeon]|nr:DIP1984 family protein [Methanomassiliicoccaceae archaeon]
MKLAEALLLRSEYQKKIENLQSRILVNVKVQENDSPHENPQDLIREAFDLAEQLCTLIKKINACNNETMLPNGLTISEAIVERDMLMKKRNILAFTVTVAQDRDYRLTHSEVKMNVTVSVEETQKQIDAISQKFRELDTQIQGANWITDMD